MSDELLAIVNRRTAISAVRAEAARVGLDAERLLDSKTLYDRATALDVDDPGFPRLVGELVREHATQRGLTAGAPAQQATRQPPVGQLAAQPATPRQWTEADVAALPKTREGSDRLQAAMDAGLLTDLGYGRSRRRR
jgi:hypothetical protein